jgi:hypothetical protein
VLFGEEKKEPMVKTLRGGLATRKGLKNLEKDSTSKLRSSSPSGERDAVRAWGRVIRAVDGGENVVESGFGAEGSVSFLAIAS